MKKKNKVLSALIFMLSVVVGAVFYVIVFRRFDRVWFEFQPIFYLCVITFSAAFGIYISAIVIDTEEQEQNN